MFFGSLFGVSVLKFKAEGAIKTGCLRCVIQFLSKLSSRRTIYLEHTCKVLVWRSHTLAYPPMAMWIRKGVLVKGQNWLECRGASRNGNKAALIERVNDYWFC